MPRSFVLSMARAFTVLELLTTLAFLVIVLGVLVSLARYVRATSAQDVTRRTLLELEEAWSLVYPSRPVDSTEPATMPSVEPPPQELDEAMFEQYVQRTSVPLIRQLLQRARAAGAADGTLGVTAALPAGEAEQVVRDAWGSPIALLLSQHPGIGMAPQNRPFFVSAGPDGRYLTRDDNLYSYEVLRPSATPARPAAGGHRE